ncbi:hypothetical protein ACFLVH_05270 [Chloroflexota bacterium]
MSPTVVYARVIFITAIVNLITIILILLSCRCINTWKLTSSLTKYY